MLSRPLGMIENQRRTEFANACCRVSHRTCAFEDRFLIQIVAGEMRIDLAQHRVALERWRDAAAGAGHLKRCVDCVAEVSGIAEQVSCRHARGVGRGEGRE